MDQIERKLEETQTEMVSVKQDASDMKGEIDDLKVRVTETEGAVSQTAIIKSKLDEMQKEMEEKFEFLARTTAYHQSMLETTDAKFRATHVIIYGVPENDNTLGINDKERVLKVIENTKALENETLDNILVKRLGVEQTNANTLTQMRPRALHVTLSNQEQQRRLLEGAKNLKGLRGFDRVYIKKDKHPTVRREMNRLKKKEKEEKDNPDNAGTTIRYDYKKRELLKDNIVIDRFCPSFH